MKKNTEEKGNVVATVWGKFFFPIPYRASYLALGKILQKRMNQETKWARTN